MFNSIFFKKETDLDGKVFKQKFETTDNAELIDVRTPGEFSSGTIKGAKNMNLMGTDFEKMIQKLNKDSTYFLFCRSGSRSSSAVSLFEKLGFKAYNLVGGMAAWPV